MPDQLPTLEFQCFGPPVIRVDGAEPPTDVLWRKNVALLAYLALSPGRTRSREHLLGLLWPEKDQTKARHSLNEAVRRLRSGLGMDRIRSKGDTLTLDDKGLSVDADDLEQALTRGDFLEGLTLDDAPAFEDWVMAERTRHRTQASSALLRAGERELAALRFDGAHEAAARVLALDAYSEPAARLRMRAATLAGDAAGALRGFHEFANRLKAEFSENPSRELTALAECIRNGRWRRRSVASPDVDPPLVGRAAVHEEIFHLVGEAFRGAARTAAILGDSGSGKTRLLGECVNRWQLDGGFLVVGRALEQDRDAEWSALRALARGGLLDAPGLAGTDPAALAVLASVIPELSERVEPSPVLDHAHVATALVSLIRAVVEEQPVAIVLDDAHWADASTLGACQTAMAQLRNEPVLLAVAAADGGSAPGTRISLVGEIGRRLPGMIVRLGPLTEADITSLVMLLADWCPDDEQRDRLARRVWYETSGNPLLATTLLQGLRRVTTLREDATQWPPPRQTIDAAVPFDVPELVRLMTIARANELSEQGRQVLVAATIGPRVIDPKAIVALTELDSATVDRGLEELERHRFVVFDGDRFHLEAPIIAAVIRGEFLTPSRRKRLETRLAEWSGAHTRLD